MAAIILPYLIWVNARILWKGEIFLTDDAGKISSHYSRQTDPVLYWLLAAFNLAVLAGSTTLAIWAFSR